jgi:hypothetical protein
MDPCGPEAIGNPVIGETVRQALDRHPTALRTRGWLDRLCYCEGRFGSHLFPKFDVFRIKVNHKSKLEGIPGIKYLYCGPSAQHRDRTGATDGGVDLLIRLGSGQRRISLSARRITVVIGLISRAVARLYVVPEAEQCRASEPEALAFARSTETVKRTFDGIAHHDRLDVIVPCERDLNQRRPTVSKTEQGICVHVER